MPVVKIDSLAGFYIIHKLKSLSPFVNIRIKPEHNVIELNLNRLIYFLSPVKNYITVLIKKRLYSAQIRKKQYFWIIN